MDANEMIAKRNAEINTLANQFMREMTVYDMALLLAEHTIRDRERPKNKIVVTEEEMAVIQNLFKIKGQRENGEKETRGRKPKCYEQQTSNV